jgi:flavin-binding protein dodecin
VIELAGTSTESWQKAAVVAVETALNSLHDPRIAEVVELDTQL